MNTNVMMRERILITGPGGRVGTYLVPLMREHFALRLLDLKALKAEGDDEVLQGDIRNFDLLKRVKWDNSLTTGA